MNMVRSYYEKIILEKVYELFDDSLIDEIKVNEYYDWLANPKTKKPLQIDILIIFKEKFISTDKDGNRIFKDVILGLEIQGEQHYKFVNEFHKRKYDLYQQKFRDDVKSYTCVELGIPLFRIKFNRITWKFNLREFLLQKLNKRSFKCEYGNKNKEYLIELVKNSKKWNYRLTKMNKDDLFRLNEISDFLKKD